MSVIDDKIQTELNAIDIKALIVERATVKIDAILGNRNINAEIDKLIRNKIIEDVNNKLSE